MVWDPFRVKNHLVRIILQCTYLKPLDFPTSHNSGPGVAPSAVRSCPAQLAGSDARLRCAKFGRTKDTSFAVENFKEGT